MKLPDSENKFCLIVSLSTPWENYHREQFIKNIADKIKEKNGIVIGVEPTVLSFFNLVKYPERIIKWLSGKYNKRKVYDNIYVLPAFTLEHILLSVRFKWLSRINSKMLNQQLTKYIKEIDSAVQKRVLMLHRPELHFLIGKLNDSGAIYDCCDDHCQTSNMNQLKVKGNYEREKILAGKCNFIIATSLNLYKRNKKYNQDTYLVENGYLFSETVTDLQIEQVLSVIKEPVIGYIGNVRDWMDYEILEYLFDSMHDVKFVFMGSIDKNARKRFEDYQNKYKNIILTGRVNYNSLPDLMKYFSVGIIPFKMNEFMRSVNPNKFYEMISTGLPVVTTNIGDIAELYGDIAKTASDKIEFKNKILELLDLNKEQISNLRDKIKFKALNHTWDKKSRYFTDLLFEKIKIN